MTWRIRDRSTQVASNKMGFGTETQLKFICEQIASVTRTVNKFFFERMTTFSKRIAQVVRTGDNFFWTVTRSRSKGYQIRLKTANGKELFHVRGHAKGLTKYYVLKCPLIHRFSGSLTFLVFYIFTNKLSW